MSKLVEDSVRKCEACQCTTQEKTRTPLHMTPLPEAPWQSVVADFAGPLPGNKYLLVVVDEYSRFPLVAEVTSLNTTSVTSKLFDMFAVHGIPEKLKTDNGPPWFGRDFADFVQNQGVRHYRTTPLWPEANGEVERFVKNVKKVVKASVATGRDWKHEIKEYLLNYRATPHSTTGRTPAELLFGRKIRTKLPGVGGHTCDDSEVRAADESNKLKAKLYADVHRHAKQHKLSKGDTVLLRRPRPLSCESMYDPDPYKVIHVQGSCITALRKGKKVMRNSCFFKKVPERAVAQSDDDWEVAYPSTGQENDQSEHDDRPTTGDPHARQEGTTGRPVRRNPDRQARHRLPQKFKDFQVNVS